MLNNIVTAVSLEKFELNVQYDYSINNCLDSMIEHKHCVYLFQNKAIP